MPDGGWRAGLGRMGAIRGDVGHLDRIRTWFGRP
ncbi:hypothetical protein SMF913_10573 [Streptomyces malaysiensis]|uniref:Uncharacterized protein n=1 Tax=Streptomyces malaysiensis TaxID=92644 RepID=A0A2J7Z2P3_STRMQ|nr:hypothetical protein SMF913_10573 [Streptomyces malaysiensis]